MYTSMYTRIYLYIIIHRFLCFSSIFSCFSYSYLRQTKLASSLLSCWAHDKIIFDLIGFDLIFLDTQTSDDGQSV